MSNFLDLLGGVWHYHKVSMTELKASPITSEELANVAARFDVTAEQLGQLKNEFGPLIVRGDHLGYMSEGTHKFEMLLIAGD